MGVEIELRFEMLEVSTHPSLDKVANDSPPEPVTFLELRPRRVFTAAGVEATGRDVRSGAIGRHSNTSREQCCYWTLASTHISRSWKISAVLSCAVAGLPYWVPHLQAMNLLQSRGTAS